MMQSVAVGMAVGFVLAGFVVLAVWRLRRKRRKASAGPTVLSSIQHMRAIGQLSVFKVITKEIVTETDHTWGEFGRKYLSWVLSNKKMAMIFEFEIDFRFDLRRPDFEILEAGGDTYTIRMPPCSHEAHIRDIRFYDEQRSRLLPWLLPELLNGFLSGGLTEENRNCMVAAAKAHAQSQAMALIDDLQSEVRQSARATLSSIAKAFGAETLRFEFGTGRAVQLHVDMARNLTGDQQTGNG